MLFTVVYFQISHFSIYFGVAILRYLQMPWDCLAPLGQDLQVPAAFWTVEKQDSAPTDCGELQGVPWVSDPNWTQRGLFCRSEIKPLVSHENSTSFSRPPKNLHPKTGGALQV